MNRKIHNGGGVRKRFAGGEKWNPMDDLRKKWLSPSTEFSGFRFDGFVPAEEIERSKICRVSYFFDSHFHVE